MTVFSLHRILQVVPALRLNPSHPPLMFTVAIRRQQSAVRPSTAVLVHRPRRSAFIGSASIEGGLPRRPVRAIWQRRTNVWRRVTSPAGAAKLLRNVKPAGSVTHRRLSMSDETDN